MAHLEIKQLYKIFGPHPDKALAQLKAGVSKQEIIEDLHHAVALQDVSLSITPGETFVVMGLSGSGKSTFVRCLNRLIEPTSGEIYLDGEDILALDKKGLQYLRRHKMSMVFQGFGLFPHRTVLENVAFGLEIRGLDAAERQEVARHWLETVGLTGWENSYPVQLSGGMQQRVGLARALTNDPEILLMDEPFSALDPLIRRSMQEELLNLQAKLHKTIIFITHDLDEALHLGDRIAILKDGKVDQVGTPEDILTAPATPYVAEFTQDVNRSRAIRAATVMIKPRALALDHSGPRRALKLMDEQGVSSAYVVDRNRRFIGVASVDDVLSAARRGDKDLQGIALTQVPSVAPDTILQELLPIAASTSLPIAVVNGDGVLIGIVPRVRILSALAGERDEEEPRQVTAESTGGEETSETKKAPGIAEATHPFGANSKERS